MKYDNMMEKVGYHMEGNFGGWKFWCGETLVNLANDHKFTKVSPTNFFHTVASFVINILK